MTTKDFLFMGEVACRGPRERHSPGPNLALNGPASSWGLLLRRESGAEEGREREQEGLGRGGEGRGGKGRSETPNILA